MSKGSRLHITTYNEQDSEGWWCVCDIARTLAQIPGADLEESNPLRVGPFRSRQVARRELRGDFRKLVVKAVQAYVAAHGGNFERFIIGE